jgi:hypothetical protein
MSNQNNTTTAVDWLISKLPKLPPDIIPDEEWFGIIGEAREMEREQIIEAHHQGEMNVLEGIFETELTEARNDKEDATMYYDKTYGESE